MNMQENTGRQLNDEISLLDAAYSEMVGRILKVGNPRKIILFGSRARGDARKDSDVDQFYNPRSAVSRKNEYKTRWLNRELHWELIVQLCAA